MKIKVSLGIGLRGSYQEDVIDIEDAEWLKCKDEFEREKLIHETWKGWLWEHIDGEHKVATNEEIEQYK